MRKLLASTTVGAGLLLAVQAQAVQYVGDFRIALTNPGLADGATRIGVGETLTASGAVFVSGSGAFQSFTTAGVGNLSFGDLTLTENSPFTFDAGFGAFTGNVDAVEPSLQGGVVVRLALTLTGTFFFNTTNFPGADPNPSDAGGVLILTQERGTTAIGADFLLETPRGGTDPGDIPTPMSLALFGVGLAGLGLAARRRRAAAAATV